MTIYRVTGRLSEWNAIRIKYGRDEPGLFLKITTATTNAHGELARVLLSTAEYRFLKAEADAYDMHTEVITGR